jgi:hypothetical protein
LLPASTNQPGALPSRRDRLHSFACSLLESWQRVRGWQPTSATLTGLMWREGTNDPGSTKTLGPQRRLARAGARRR